MAIYLCAGEATPRSKRLVILFRSFVNVFLALRDEDPLHGSQEGSVDLSLICQAQGLFGPLLCSRALFWAAEQGLGDLEEQFLNRT